MDALAHQPGSFCSIFYVILMITGKIIIWKITSISLIDTVLHFQRQVTLSWVSATQRPSHKRRSDTSEYPKEGPGDWEFCTRFSEQCRGQNFQLAHI